MGTSTAQRLRNRALRNARRALARQQANMVRAEALSKKEIGVNNKLLWEVYESLKTEARR